MATAPVEYITPTFRLAQQIHDVHGTGHVLCDEDVEIAHQMVADVAPLIADYLERFFGDSIPEFEMGRITRLIRSEAADH